MQSFFSYALYILQWQFPYLFSFSFYNILYYKGLYSGYNIPILYIWIKCNPIISNNNNILGIDYGYEVLYYI